MTTTTTTTGVQPSVLGSIQEFMPLIAVRKALAAAAGGTDAAYIVDKVSKVELRTEMLHDRYAVQLVLRIWWELEEGEFHVVDKRVNVEDGQIGTYEDVLAKLLDFKPEDALRFAAFI